MKWYEKQKKAFQDSAQKSEDDQSQETWDAQRVDEEEQLREDDNSELHVLSEASDEFKEQEEPYEEVDSTIFNAVEEQSAEPQEKFEATIISKGACIHGDVEIKGDLHIQGSIYGNVDCGGSLEVDGVIEGNVKMQSGCFDSAIIKGDIDCKSLLIVENGTSINGDVKAQKLQADGKIKGAIHAEEEILLMAHASVEGDVEAQFMEIERGALLNGRFIVLADKDS